MVREEIETEKKNAVPEEITEEPEAPEEPEKPRKSRMDGIQRQAFLLTINNPQKYDMGHEKIKQSLVLGFPTLKFFCMADEIGEQGTYHTHVYIHFNFRVRVGKIKKYFPSAHIDIANGTAKNNVEYVKKSGKWKDTEKAETSVPNTYEEWGTMPTQKGRRSDLEDLMQMVEAGYTVTEILQENNDMILYMDKIEKIRQAFLNEKFKGKRRLDLHVTYIWGATGRGKTRSIMDAYGDSNVYRVIENGGGHPFDQYDGHAVIVFEEFRSSFKISDMLNYLDVYPVTLPARYCNKVVCYNRVFITTNIPLEDQYTEVQKESPETWAAFLRRIHEVQVYLEDGTIVKYDSVEKYLNRNKEFHKLEPADECPFN